MQSFEKFQYDLMQEKLRKAPIIPEDGGEQTVVTFALAASGAEPGDRVKFRFSTVGREFDRKDAVFMGQNTLM